MRTSTRYVINAVSNWGQLVVSSVVGVIILRYAVDKLGKEQFGLFPIVGSFLAIVMLLDLGISSAVARFSARNQGAGDLEALRGTITTALFVMASLGLAGAGVLVALIPFINRVYEVPPHYYGGLIGLTLWQAVAFALRFAAVPAAAVLIGAGRYELMNAFEAVGNLVRLGLLVVLFSAFRPSLSLFGLTFAAHQVVRLVSFNLLARYAVVRAPLYRRQTLTWSVLRELGQFSAIQSLGVLAWTALLQGPNLIIGRLLGNEMVTYYQPCLLVASQLAAFMAGLTSPLLPLAAQDAETNAGRRLGEWSLRFGRLVTVFALAMFLPIALLARPILTIWMTEDFTWTAPVLVVLVGAQLVNLSQSANFYLLLGGGRTTFWQVSEIIGACLALGLAVLGQLWFDWGLFGIAACVSVVIVVRSGIFLPWMCAKQFNLPLGHYYVNVYCAPALVAALAGAAGLALLRAWPAVGIWPTVAHAMLVTTLFGGLSWFLALSSADRQLFLGWIGRLRVGKPTSSASTHEDGRTSPTGSETFP